RLPHRRLLRGPDRAQVLSGAAALGHRHPRHRRHLEDPHTVNTPAKAPLTLQQIIDRASELGIAVERLRFFDEETLNGGAGAGDGAASAADLHDYTQLTDVGLRRVREPAEGLFIAESSKIIRRAHASGLRPRSYLTSPKWLFDLADVIADSDVPIFIGTDAAVETLTGFHLHRGALAAMHRPALADPASIAAAARRPVRDAPSGAGRSRLDRRRRPPPGHHRRHRRPHERRCDLPFGGGLRSRRRPRHPALRRSALPALDQSLHGHGVPGPLDADRIL